MNKFKEFLQKLLGKEVVDAFSEEQLKTLESFEKSLEGGDGGGSAGGSEGGGGSEKDEESSVKQLIADLSAQVNTLSKNLEAVQAERDKLYGEFNDYKRGNLVKALLKDSGVVDTDDFIKLYDETIKGYEDDKLEDSLKSLLTTAKESKPHLFKTLDSGNGGGFNPPAGSQASQGYVKGMSFSEALKPTETSR